MSMVYNDNFLTSVLMYVGRMHQVVKFSSFPKIDNQLNYAILTWLTGKSVGNVTINCFIEAILKKLSLAKEMQLGNNLSLDPQDLVLS